MAGRPSKLSELQIAKVKIALACGESVKSLAIDYGVSVQVISKIKTQSELSGFSHSRKVETDIYVTQFTTGQKFALELYA